MFVREKAIGDYVADSLRLHPEQWALQEGRVLGREYTNKRERWTLTATSMPFTGTAYLNFSEAALTSGERKRILRALDQLDDLRRDQARSDALRKHLKRGTDD